MNTMQNINVLSLTPAVSKWLTNSHYPRILHLFDHACNLINEHRDVLSIVTPQFGNGPFNLVIEDAVLFFDNLNLQSPVSNSPNHIILGDLTISIDNAKLWSPRPDWERLHTKRNDITKLLLTNSQQCGLDTPFAKTAQGYSTTDSLQSPISNSLISALANADLSASLAAAQQLAGLGIGLTPAGDDIILGAVLAAWIIHPFEIVSTLAKEIANTAAPLTTSLSAAWLKSAGNGEAGILWHEFFDSLMNADAARIQAAMDKILAVGATSGADTLVGFIGTFISYAEQETDHVIPKHF
jgi:hypothetical protein